MRTKTPQQIYEQARRIFDAIAYSCWDGEKYIRTDKMCARLDKVHDITERYINNIYDYHVGVGNRKGLSTEESNRIFHLPTPVINYINR